MQDDMINPYLSHVLRNLIFAYAKTKARISCAVTAQLISVFFSLHSIFPQLPKSKISSEPSSVAVQAQFVSDLV